MSEDISDINALVKHVSEIGNIDDHVSDIRKELAALKASVFETGKEVIGRSLGAFFNKHPEVAAVCWNQYIPYWDDGSPCEFGLSDVIFLPRDRELSSADEAEDYEYVADDPFSTTLTYEVVNGKYVPKEIYADQRMTKALADDMHEIEEALGVSEDVLEACFGSHSCVYVNRNGVKVTEYTDHD